MPIPFCSFTMLFLPCRLHLSSTPSVLFLPVRPWLFINGSQDVLFPVAGVEKAFRTMHDVWNSQGAGEKIQTELWDMPHSCGLRSQQCVLSFFKKHL